MGPWYLNTAKTQNFPSFPANSGTLVRFPRTPTIPAAKTLTPAGPIGYFVDGVAAYDNRDTFSYTNASGADGSPMGGGRGDGGQTGNVNPATNPVAYTGSGGGGGGNFSGALDGTPGASGIVMIRYQIYANGTPV